MSCNQPITPGYYDFLNDNDDDKNTTTGTHVEYFLLDNKGVEGAFIPNAPDDDANDENIYDDTVIYNADSLTLAIDSLQEEMMENEGVDVDNEGVNGGGRLTVDADGLPPE